MEPLPGVFDMLQYWVGINGSEVFKNGRESPWDAT